MSRNVIGWRVTMVIYVLRDSYSCVCVFPDLLYDFTLFTNDATTISVVSQHLQRYVPVMNKPQFSTYFNGHRL